MLQVRLDSFYEELRGVETLKEGTEVEAESDERHD